MFPFKTVTLNGTALAPHLTLPMVDESIEGEMRTGYLFLKEEKGGVSLTTHDSTGLTVCKVPVYCRVYPAKELTLSASASQLPVVAGGYALVSNSIGQVLLVKRSGKLSVPGGIQPNGKTLIEQTKLMVLEETGVNVVLHDTPGPSFIYESILTESDSIVVTSNAVMTFFLAWPATNYEKVTKEGAQWEFPEVVLNKAHGQKPNTLFFLECLLKRRGLSLDYMVKMHVNDTTDCLEAIKRTISSVRKLGCPDVEILKDMDIVDIEPIKLGRILCIIYNTFTRFRAFSPAEMDAYTTSTRHYQYTIPELPKFLGPYVVSQGVSFESKPAVQGVASESKLSVKLAPSEARPSVKIVPPESEECVVCLEGPKHWMFRTCNHRCVCEACAKALRTSNAPCPICRGVVTGIERVY